MNKFLLLLFSCATTGLWAAEPQLSAELASRNAFLGDGVTLSVRITHDENWILDQQDPPKEMGDATVLSHQWTVLPKQEGALVEITELQLKLAWYRLGEFKLPPFEVTLLGDGEKKLLSTPELTIDIVNMLGEEDEDLAPAKGQVNLDVPLLWPWIVAGIVLVLLAVALVVYFMSRAEKPEKPAPPPKPPYQEAIDALGALTSGSLLKEGKFKEFHVAITLIVRHYYARLYSIHGEEMTTFELEEWMETESHRLPGELFYLNRSFQEQCDRVKYAKHDPVEAENKETTNRAYQILEMLKPTVAEQEASDVAVG